MDSQSPENQDVNQYQHVDIWYGTKQCAQKWDGQETTNQETPKTPVQDLVWILFDPQARSVDFGRFAKTVPCSRAPKMERISITTTYGFV